MFLLCLKELFTNNIEICKLVCFVCSLTDMAFPLSHLPLLRFYPLFLYFAGERLKGKICVWGVTFKSSEVSNFPQWIAISESSVILAR